MIIHRKFRKISVEVPGLTRDLIHALVSNQVLLVTVDLLARNIISLEIETIFVAIEF